MECSKIKWAVASGHTKTLRPHQGNSGPGRRRFGLHEIKHDGYRLMVRKDGDALSIITRGGYDWTERYPLIAAGALRLRGSFVIDGEGVVAVPMALRISTCCLHARAIAPAFSTPFDMMEKSGDDLRPLPLKERKARLRSSWSDRRLGLFIRTMSPALMASRSTLRPVRWDWKASCQSDAIGMCPGRVNTGSRSKILKVRGSVGSLKSKEKARQLSRAEFWHTLNKSTPRSCGSRLHNQSRGGGFRDKETARDGGITGPSLWNV